MGELRDRMEADLKLRGLAVLTQRAYLRVGRAFAAYFRRSPAEMGEPEIRKFLVHLDRERKVQPATRYVYTAALKFLYKVTLQRPQEVARIPFPKVPRKLPDILSGTEVERLLGAIRSLKYRVIIMVTYASGLRINEAVSLKPADIDSPRGVIHVRLGKGKKDRLVPLSPRCLLLLREYWKEFRPSGPYLFPGQRPGTHLTDRAVRKALQKAVGEAGITKRVSPHVLRHCFTTHLLEAGANMAVIQQLLGHASLNTTSRYAHVRSTAALQVGSPLDLLGTPQGEPLG
jgi:site-specific recombinase XerD